MFDKEEIFLLKELVKIEIDEVDNMIKTSNDLEKLELKNHKNKLLSIFEKLNNL